MSGRPAKLGSCCGPGLKPSERIVSGGGPAVGFTQAKLTREGVDLVDDLAWLVTASEQGRGLAGEEAVSAVVTRLTVLGVGRLQAHVHPGHAASARVAERLGLVPTSTVVDDEILR